MDPMAIGLLLSNLLKLADFGATILKAHSEGRTLTPEELAAFRDKAKSAIDELDAKIAAHGG